MSGNSNGRLSVVVKAIVPLASLASFALLGFVLAYWAWQWFAPKPEPRSAVGIETPSRSSAADTLFGNAPKDSNTTDLAVSSPIKLLGVAAASGNHRGHAVFQVGGKKALVVREGDDILSGVGLAEVHAEHVVVDRSGVREKLVLPRK